MYAAVRADKRFQTEVRQRLAHSAEYRLAVLALLVAEVYKIGVDAAAFQQTEALEQSLALQRMSVTADDGQIPGNAERPQLAFGRAAMRAVRP